MNQFRIKFSKSEPLQYISHLDVLKVFERVFIRSGIPVAYSAGFNPRPQIIFGLPSAVGILSQAEFADIVLDKPYEANTLMVKLNEHLPEGIQLTDAKAKISKKNIMAEIHQSSYVSQVEIFGIENVNSFLEQGHSFFSQGEIMVIKSTKKRLVPINIKSQIRSFGLDFVQRVQEKVHLFDMSFCIDSGSRGNLRPEALIQAFKEFIGQTLTILSIKRLATMVEKEGRVYEPMDEQIINV